MKVAVIIAVLQMTLGIIIRGLNNRFFKQMYELVHVVLPQLILMIVMIGYMDLLIIIKWTSDYTNKEYEAPSVISTMINMFLNGGEAPDNHYMFNG